MEHFLQVLFEEMCIELEQRHCWKVSCPTITPKRLWEDTLLTRHHRHHHHHCLLQTRTTTTTTTTNANSVVMASVLLLLSFSLTIIPPWRSSPLMQRMSSLDVPLDVSVYSNYRCFRLYGNTKIGSCRPLVLARYNRCTTSSDEEDPLKLFLLSVIAQHLPPTVVVAMMKDHRRPDNSPRSQCSWWFPCRSTAFLG